MKILVTGFEPVYEKYNVNASWEAVRNLPDQLEGTEIEKWQLPCVYRTIDEALITALDCAQPDVLLCVGYAGRSHGLEVEWLGINRDDCSLPDNEGVVRQGTPIREDGADAYFTDLPVDAIIRSIQKAGIPAYQSYTAGQYFCNHALYLGRYLANTAFPGLKSGFIHVPMCAAQVQNGPASAHIMEIPTITAGLEAAIRAIIHA